MPTTPAPAANATPWHGRATVRTVLPLAPEHTLHAYFNTCPESPDGRWVVMYRSLLGDGVSGELIICERASGAVRRIAHIHAVEDAHRSACQQWVAGGRLVAFHDFRGGRWQVLTVDVQSGRETVAAEDRLLGFAHPGGRHLPLYGLHWNPGRHRDLELVDVDSGQIRPLVTMAAVAAEYGTWLTEEFGTKQTSLFFPVVSPDGSRVFFKVAAGSGGDDFRTPLASHRSGMLVADVSSGRIVRRLPTWGHPSWAPDSRAIFEKGNTRIDLQDGTEFTVEQGAPSDHPSLSPDGRWYVTDGKVLARDGGKPGEWGIFVGSTTIPGYTIVHRFDQRGGADSWRPPHPHPAINHDGRRIYFNRNDGPWSRLMVAERFS